MKHWINKNYRTLIVLAFLIPIITVAIVSISHVTTWYGVSNPITWAVYLSVGVEIAAMSAVAALSANVGKNIYVPFIIVTLIQFIGNVFFSYNFIHIDSESFKAWVELVSPILQFAGIEATNFIAHKRFLALLAGGLLPVISLSFLHMLVKFTEEQRLKELEEENEASNTENSTTEYTKNGTAEKAINNTEEVEDLMAEKVRIEEQDKINLSEAEMDEVMRRLARKPKTKEQIIQEMQQSEETEDNTGLKEYIEKVVDNFDVVGQEDYIFEEPDSEPEEEDFEEKPGYIKPELEKESWDNIRDEVLNEEPVENQSNSTTEKDSNPPIVEKKNFRNNIYEKKTYGTR